MTNQELFDKVATHLLTQGKQALLDNGKVEDPSCAYRATQADGTVLSCAVGCLIPDDRYEPSFEGAALRPLVVKSTNIIINPTLKNKAARIADAAGLEPENYEIAIALQAVHDHYDAPSVWLGALQNVAKDFHLSPAVLKPWEEEAAERELAGDEEGE